MGTTKTLSDRIGTIQSNNMNIIVRTADGTHATGRIVDYGIDYIEIEVPSTRTFIIPMINIVDIMEEDVFDEL